MLSKFLVALAGVVLLVVLAMPFGREIYYRFEVWRQLDGPGDRAAFEAWHGSAREFQQQLRDRCLHVYGAGAQPCERYRTVSN